MSASFGRTISNTLSTLEYMVRKYIYHSDTSAITLNFFSRFPEHTTEPRTKFLASSLFFIPVYHTSNPFLVLLAVLFLAAIMSNIELSDGGLTLQVKWLQVTSQTEKFCQAQESSHTRNIEGTSDREYGRLAFQQKPRKFFNPV